MTRLRGRQNKERAYLVRSINGGNSYGALAEVSAPGDRANQPAVAIAPDGSDVYVTYNAYLQPWQPTTDARRPMLGVVEHVAADGTLTSLHRGVEGDARGSSSNGLKSEFLGDYNYAFATNDAVVAVWNDVRDAADCPAIDTYRQALVNGAPGKRPAPNTDCPQGVGTPAFGDSSIYGGRYADPTP